MNIFLFVLTIQCICYKCLFRFTAIVNLKNEHISVLFSPFFSPLARSPLQRLSLERISSRPEGWSSGVGDCTHSWERGEWRGVYLAHTIRAYVFPYVCMSTGGLMVSNPGSDSKGPVFESRSSRKKNIYLLINILNQFPQQLDFMP